MPDPLRVVLLTGKMSPAAGGLSVSVPGLASGLAAYDDIEMHILGTQDPQNPAAAMSWGQRAQAFPISGPAALQRAPGMAAAVHRLAPDVIDVQGLWTWASRVSLDYWRRHRRPYVVTPRGMLDPWARRNSAWKKLLFGAFAENAHLQHAYCLRATAEMEAEHFRAMGLRAPIAVVPNSVSIPDLLPRPATHRSQILFLSRIHPKKGVNLLLQAWAMLQSRHPSWDLVIAGMDENGYEAELKAQATQLAVQRVSFIGPVHGAAKDLLYRKSDVFVLPTHAENFGLVVAEALAQEVPVITTTNAPWGGMEDKQCGWWIPLNVERLANTMTHAMTLPREDLRMMGANGRAWMKSDFAPEQTATKMRDVYMWCTGRAQKPDHVHE